MFTYFANKNVSRHVDLAKEIYFQLERSLYLLSFFEGIIAFPLSLGHFSLLYEAYVRRNF